MSKRIVIGILDEEKLEFIKEKNPEFFQKIVDPEIIMWDERLAHIEKHRPNYKCIYDLDEYIELIPDIIANPDYIGIKDGLQFIKQFDNNVLIAVRVNAKGKLSLRTMYPITDSQINDYIRKGTAWKYG